MSNQQTLSYNQWLQAAEQHLQSGNPLVAKNIYIQILKQMPHDSKVRELLRKSVRSQEFNDSEYFVSSFESLFMSEPDYYIQPAANGWRFVNGFDRSYIDASLSKEASKDAPGADNSNESKVNKVSGDTNGSLIDYLLGIEEISKRWEESKSIINSDDPRVVQDDYAGKTDQELLEQLVADQSGDSFNITIIGGGCTGLALANCLKKSLGERVNILVIENRVREPHVKKNYERYWLMQLPTSVLGDVVDSRVSKLLDSFGDGPMIGSTVALFETLLLLSCREMGVRFLFRKDYDLSFLEKAGTHMVFDATGRRLSPPAEVFKSGHTNPEADNINFSIVYDENYGRGFNDFGVHDYGGDRSETIQLHRNGNFLVPHKQGQPLRTALVKLTHIPLELNDTLLELIGENRDSLFYIWKGKQKTQINELLILINLDIESYQYLAECIPTKMSLKQFVNDGFLNQDCLDPRLVEFITYIVEKESAAAVSKIEPPFVYEPYVRLMAGTLDRVYDKALIPIGDSVFNGHPKVGNGVLAHLKTMIKLHDQILFLFGNRAKQA